MINEFITAVKKRGLARTNRYSVIIPFPNGGGERGRLATIFCDQVTLPGISVATTPSRFYGETREMAYERVFEPVTMSFYVDMDMEIKTAFDDWMNSIVNPVTRAISYYDSYVRPVFIYVENDEYTPTNSAPGSVGNLDPVNGRREAKSPYMITLQEAYPKTVNAITLDTGSKEIMKLTVQFQYRYWEPTSTSAVATAVFNPNTSNQDSSTIYTTTGYSADEYDIDYVNQDYQNDFGYGP